MPHCALLPLRGSRHTHDLRGHSPKVPHGYHQSPGRAPGRDPHQGLSLTCSSFSKNDFILSMGFCVSSCSAFNIICFVFVTSSSLSQLENIDSDFIHMTWVSIAEGRSSAQTCEELRSRHPLTVPALTRLKLLYCVAMYLSTRKHMCFFLTFMYRSQMLL